MQFPKSSQTIAVPNTGTLTSSPVFRNKVAEHGLVERPRDDVHTIHDLLAVRTAEHPTTQMLGQRRILNIVEEQKEVEKTLPDGTKVTELKTWKYFELSGYEWLTWQEASDLAKLYASGYRALGLQPGDKLTIFAETSRDWFLNAWACFNQSITITTAYATLGEEGLTYSLQESIVNTIFTNADLLPMILKVAKACPVLKNVVYNGSADIKILEKLKAEAGHLNILSLHDLRDLGERNVHASVPPTDKDNVALIMYTSGSTGPPKGVMITHGNMVAVVAANTILAGKVWSKKEQEVMLSFLPLAHILEWALEMTYLWCGAKIGYGNIKTLTDASVRNCKGDIRELRPTLMGAVPAVYEGIRKGIEGKIRDSSKLAQAMFRGAFKMKRFFINNKLNFLAYPLDAIVFSKVKAQVGGKLRLAFCGGAPLPMSTHEFMNVCVTNVFVGYGMTEGTASATIQEPAEYTIGNVGYPVADVEITLVDVPEAGYLSTNPLPQGEIWVRGPNVMKGYFKQPELTKEALTTDGWLMTGDVGQMNKDGTLSIIDRKKNLVKLSNGEYIALEKLESNYKVSKFVQNICVYADSEKSYAIALVFPVEKEIRIIATTLGLYPAGSTPEFKELCERKEVRAEVLKSLKDVAKSIGLKPAEIVGQVVLCHEEWTPQNGLLTAVMKLQRKQIASTYRTEIQAVYV